MSASRNPATWRSDLLVLAAALVVFFGFRLGSYPLANPDEGRNAEVPREMLASGDWVTPKLDGVDYFEKPPLVYWAVAGMEKVFGLNEWAVRAVPALFAIGGVLLTYAAARRLYGRGAGVVSAIVLATSLLYYGTGRFLVLDTAVSVLMAATLVCFILGVNEPVAVGATVATAGLPEGAARAPRLHRRRWFFYGLYASAALATLTKGFIGFLVTGAVMFLWLLVFNQWKRLRPLYLPTGALLFLAIALPWHVLAAERNPTWAHRYIYFEHWERFFTTAHGRVQPWHFFIWILLAGLIPWTAFLWPALREAVGCRAGSPDPALQSGRGWRGAWARRGERATEWFFVTWAGFILLFFSASHSKLPAYILPVFPAIAVLIGAWLAKTAVAQDGVARLRWPLRIFSFVCGLLVVALLVVVLRPGLVIRDAWQAEALRTPAIVLAIVLLAGGIVAPAWARLRGATAALTIVTVTMLAFLLELTFAAPDVQKPGTEKLALIVRAKVQPGDRVAHYHDYFHDFSFYAERVVDVIGSRGPSGAIDENISELELGEDAAARASGRFYDDTEFHRLWAGGGRMWVVVRKRNLEELKGGGAFHYYLLGEGRDHYLISNRP
ncbi:MAG TPA: glycosyltransferase family 39 protein [Opitutus sp.]|nr:glycosyltransferase family 39 protein [Opitutus sp.]